jgi:hypothetical protein
LSFTVTYEPPSNHPATLAVCDPDEVEEILFGYVSLLGQCGLAVNTSSKHKE